jgi:cytoskeleton protein RodZ
MRETGLPSFGEKLKQEREKRKITLEQISVSTKIGTRMLQALEEDKFSQLPGGIFNKGFVRAYARCVGIDEDQTVADYLQASGDAPPPRTEIVGRDDGAPENNEENISRIEADADTPGRPLPWGLFAGILLLIALALSFWSHRQRERAKQSASPISATSASPLPGTASGGDGGPGSSTTRSVPSSSPTAAASSPRSTSPATSSATAPTTVKTSQATPAAPGEFTIQIQVRDESWVSITADGKRVESELLPAGTERSVHGRKEIIVKAGNSGGVDFHLNGKKLDTGGEYGEVRTVTFGPQGIVQSPPTAPTTP